MKRETGSLDRSRRVLVCVATIGCAGGVALAVTAVAGCGRDNPQAELEAAVQTLQDNLEAKRRDAVLEQLAPDFQARSELDREWAKRTMTLLFLQNANVKVVALAQRSRVTGETSGETDAQVVLAGGQGLVPERASPYAVKLHWRREGRQWRLARLEWE
jgi:outer membrane murein-binding lipoprotein Lpp